MSGATPELKPKMVRAGAGAGKTTGLVAQVQSVYREFKRHAERAPRIVVTTFTRKATQELKERLIRKACDDRDAEFLRFVSDPAHLHISTIHGLMSVFLKQVGHLADLDSGFQLLSESEAWQLARRALREAILQHPEGLNWFESYGFERVLHMCREYDRLAREKGAISPATAADLAAIAGPLREQWAVKLRELAQSILEQVDNEKWELFAQELLGFLQQWPEISASERPKKPANRGKDQAGLETWHAETAATLDAFDKLFAKPAWDSKFWPEMERQWQAFQSVGAQFSAELMKLKEAQGRYEMNDLELLTHKILQERPFLGGVFSESWDYWMVDEFQDTSPIQARCLWSLIGTKPRYLVGDPQQSIYLFRGADVTVFTESEAELRESGGDVEERLTNYRSSPALLRFINDFMNTVSTAFKPMEPGLEATSGPKVCDFVRAPDPELEMEALVSRVSDLVESGAPLQSICILGRTHGHLYDAAVALRRFGFPTHLHAASGFHERREVKDAQALWTFLFNPHDTHNLVTLLRSPWFFVDDTQISAWLESRPQSLWRKIGELPEVTKLREAQKLVREIGAVRTFEKMLLATGALDLCLQYDPAGRKESNLWKLIDKARQLEGEGTRSLLDLSAGDVILDPLEASEGDGTSAQEPNCINLMTVHAAKGLEFDHVIVPRMGHGLRASHAANFSVLEDKFFFPLIDSEGERIPSLLDLKILEQDAELESAEFNRALYVAATRAKASLTFTWSRLDKGSWAARSPWFQLTEGEQEREHYHFKVSESWEPPRPYNKGDRTPAKVRPKWQSTPQATGPARHSVTEMIGEKAPGSAVRDGQLLRRLESRTVGQKIHRRLEALRYGHPVGDDPLLKYVLSLKDPPMESLVRDGFAEWGFQIRTKTGVVEGQIDLWGKAGGRLYVIDYKSGSKKGLEQAFLQLEYYGAALRRFGHKEPMTLAVIYPLLEEVELKEFDDSRLTDIL